MSREIQAIRLAILTAVIGSIAKFAAGFVTGSMSMISSGVDSLGDLFVSVANLFVVRLSEKDADDDHNYGHHKVEGLGAMFEGGFIAAAGAFIIYESVHKAMIGEESHSSAVGIVVMLPILAMTIGTVMHLRKVAKETGSLVVKSDAAHYLTDVWVNIGVLVSLVLVWVTGEPLVDTAISILIALSMFRSSFHIVSEGVDVVMDKSLAPDVVARVRAVLTAEARILSFHDFKTRMGKIPHVDFHIVVPGHMTAAELHDVFLDLRRHVQDVVGPSTKVLMHADTA